MYLSSVGNIGVNNWLKNYVYFRVEAPRWVLKAGIPQKTFMNLVTKATSAFWHGFYPSYYVFFLGAWLAGEMDDAMRASFEPEDSAKKKKARAHGWWKGPTNLFELVSWAVCITVLNFWGVTFVLLRADFAWSFARNLCFLGVLLPVAITLLCRTVFRRKRAKAVPAVAVATPTAGATTADEIASPPAQIVSAVSISSASPIAPVPKHDIVHVTGPAVGEAPAVAEQTRRRRSSAAAPPAPVEDDDDGSSPADRVRSRPRRSRSNKAE